MWLQERAVSGSVQPQRLILCFCRERAAPTVSCIMFVQAELRSCMRDSILGRGWHAMFEIVRRGLTQPVGHNQENVFSSFASDLWQRSCLVLYLQRCRSA